RPTGAFNLDIKTSPGKTSVQFSALNVSSLINPEPCSLYVPSPTFPVVMYLTPSVEMSLLSIQSPSKNREPSSSAIYLIATLDQCAGTVSSHSTPESLYSG